MCSWVHALEPVMAPRRAKRRIALSAPRGTITLAGVFSALATALPVLLLNLGLDPALAEKVFIAMYLVGLPIVVSAVYQLYGLAVSVSEACGMRRPSALGFLVGVFPLGYVIPLYYVLQMFARCKRLEGKINATPMDIMLNIITFGLHSAMYAALFNKVVDMALEGLDKPY